MNKFGSSGVAPLTKHFYFFSDRKFMRVFSVYLIEDQRFTKQSHIILITSLNYINTYKISYSDSWMVFYVWSSKDKN